MSHLLRDGLGILQEGLEASQDISERTHLGFVTQDSRKGITCNKGAQLDLNQGPKTFSLQPLQTVNTFRTLSCYQIKPIETNKDQSCLGSRLHVMLCGMMDNVNVTALTNPLVEIPVGGEASFDYWTPQDAPIHRWIRVHFSGLWPSSNTVHTLTNTTKSVGKHTLGVKPPKGQPDQLLLGVCIVTITPKYSLAGIEKRSRQDFE